MDFSFFITDNKSGYKTSEKWLLKNYPKEYFEIINYSSLVGLDGSFKEKIWFYFNKIQERPKCLTCNNSIKFRERFDKPYGDFCSLECANLNKNEMVNRQQRTFEKKYGVKFYTQHQDFIIKQKKTKKERYGDENYNNSLKSKKTKKERYQDQNYNNHEKYKKTCILKYSTDNYSKSNNYKQKIKENFIKLYKNVKFTEIKKESVIVFCEKCDQNSEMSKQLLYERYKRNHEICLHCNPLGFKNRSYYEKEITDFLDKNNINYKTNINILGTKTEIDILIPEFKLAIEFNGVYWHNELFKSKNYHLEKTINCKNNDIELIHIFEDEWIYRKDIIKSIILNRINKIKNTIYARKCVIKEITSKESKEFLEQNHIQGNTNSKIKIGLFFNEKLVSVMTFSKGRIIMGGKDTEWELNRYSSLINTNVVGGASKLLKYFIKKYKPNKIISYSDIRIFNGNMYKKLGFEKISTSKPNYWYVINDIRKHRFNYNKNKLVKSGYDKNKTEREIMFERGIYRIYDCGNVRWEYNF
jgi:hypothetical protein